MISAPAIFHIEGPDGPLGDYWDILVSGMTAHLGRKKGLLQLERAGPFIPPISLPGAGDIIVTDAFKQSLQSSGLRGFTFQPVMKTRIVRLVWETWDQSLDDPPEWPRGGEPENYILAAKHSVVTADEMGDVWELCIEAAADITFEPTDLPLEYDVFVDLREWDRRDWFRGQGTGYNLVTERAKTWLELEAPEWVKFEPVSVIEAR